MQFEKDLLWDELNLGGLVGAMHNPYGISEQDSMERVLKSKILKKHNDIVQKPTYNAIMGRYDTLPHKPVSINSKKLDLLADPIKGRFMRFDESKYKLNLNAEVKLSPAKRSMRIKEDQGSSVSPVKTRYPPGNNPGGFFLTGGDDNGEPDDEEPEKNNAHQYGRSGKGLAAALRGRVTDAQKMNRQKDPMIQNKSKFGKKMAPTKNGPRGDGLVNNRIVRKKEWRDNKHVDYLSKEKGMVGKKSALGGIGRGRGEPPVDRSRNKVTGSGYGYKAATERGVATKAVLPKVTANGRHSRLLRKLTGAEEEDRAPSDTNYDSSVGRKPRRAAPAITRRAPVLRSKSALDLPDRIEESDTDNEAAQRRRGQKTRSAPAHMNRSKSSAQHPKGPVDSHGNVITLEGLTKVNRKLSPLKPLPEKTRKSRARPEATSQAPPTKAALPVYTSQAHQMMRNMNMDVMGAGSAGNHGVHQPAVGLSAEATQMAQIALARAYRQQNDPLFAQNQLDLQQQQLQHQMQQQQVHMHMQQPMQMQMQQHQQQVQPNLQQQQQMYTTSAVISNNLNVAQPSAVGSLYSPQIAPTVSPVKPLVPSSPARLLPQQQAFSADESAYQIKPQDYSFLETSLHSQTAPSPGRDTADEADNEQSDDDKSGSRSRSSSRSESSIEKPRELDAEEQLVDDLVNMDIETALQRLQKFQTSVKKSGVDIDGSALSYAKPGAVATFTKHAKNLSSNINAAESYLASYRNLADGYGGKSYGIKGEIA